MSLPRSQSVPHVSSLKITTDLGQSSTHNGTRRPKLPRHRSAVAVSGTQPFASLYTPRSEREDPFSLGGFFPTTLGAFENSPVEQEWDWLHPDTAANDDYDSPVRSGLVSPISEDDEWDIPTPCSALDDAGDALARDAIKREDKLGILTLADKLSLPPHGDELYVEDDRLLSPYTQTGDPLADEAVYDALRALRTAHSRPHGSAVKGEKGMMHELFSPEKETDDKMKVEARGWEALVSWGVSRVVDYISPV
ncbi:hypothetical protein C8Q70DRAFT_47686 [Cubamyces menziesii]|nr:hypothetical protein C8Q70DRAFT_47686 [Cubamyces menziesii]